MKLVTFHSAQRLSVGMLDDEEIVDLTEAGVTDTMLDLILGGADALAAADAAGRKAGARRLPLASARLASPIPRPGKILCSGVNYKGHADENPNAKMPSEPFFFAKLSTSVTGHDEPIRCPAQTKQLDYEVEFSAVIGKRLSGAAEEEIMPAVFGYTLLHDVSARDVQFKENQITLGKNFDGFAPIGPCIVTADEMTNPGDVRLATRLNGKTMQDGSTSDWLFPLPRLLSFLSGIMTLEPGDIVSTGTPAGVGLFRNPQVFMKPGDIVEIEAEGIGILRNQIVG